MRKLFYLFTLSFDINNNLISIFTSTYFINKPTNIGVTVISINRPPSNRT